jgi:hypothetical protein
MNQRKSAAWLAAAALCLLSAAPAASAAIHRCTGPDGKVFFSDGACPMAPSTRHAAAPEVGPAPAVAPIPEPPADLPPPPARVAPPVILPPAPPATTTVLAKLPSAEQLQHRSGLHAGPFFLGLLIWLVASIWFLVLAFTESVVWGLLVLFVPFAGFVFLVIHWGKTWKAMLASLAGVLMMALSVGSAGPPAQVAQSMLVPCTTEGEPTGPPATSFSGNDFICLKADLVWSGSALKGSQLVTWKWYKDANPVEVAPRSIDFTSSPVSVSNAAGGFALGPGLHKVELYLNGQLLDTQMFEVR